MQVGFRDLTIWSFLMASAARCGVEVLPVVLASGSIRGRMRTITWASSRATASRATLIHTLGYLTVTAAAAFVGLSEVRSGDASPIVDSI